MGAALTWIARRLASRIIDRAIRHAYRERGEILDRMFGGQTLSFEDEARKVRLESDIDYLQAAEHGFARYKADPKETR